MANSIAACAPRPIGIRSGPADCAWVQALYLGEDSIAALADAEAVLRQAGAYERAFRVRADRKAIGDHNALFERWCVSAAENEATNAGVTDFGGPGNRSAAAARF